MEIRLPLKTNTENRRPHHGTAFILEALMLLVFAMVFTVILVQLFVEARTKGNDADLLSSAIILATNDAETFAADPLKDTPIHYYSTADGALNETSDPSDEALAVIRTTDEEAREGGTLHFATIVVSQGSTVLYELSTSRYLSAEEVVAK